LPDAFGRALPRFSPGGSRTFPHSDGRAGLVRQGGGQWQQARADLLPALRFADLRDSIRRPDRDREHKGRRDPAAKRARPAAADLGAFAPILDDRPVGPTRASLGAGCAVATTASRNVLTSAASKERRFAPFQL
jgi:hypothetical protein